CGRRSRRRPRRGLRAAQRRAARGAVPRRAPDAFFPDYAVELDDLTCEELSLESADDALVLVVLAISDNGASTTANLLAPVVLNARLRLASQVILSGTDWPVRAVVA
ncbi:MAG: flagellar assembly protein FliW, partial [Sphingomonadales bacterium]|nr:flagellar assembly protein FliW [Sphingomonadales bacterium]